MPTDAGANIDTLIANSAKTNANFDLYGSIIKPYYDAQDHAYQQRVRNVFSDNNGGLPKDANGNVDSSKHSSGL